MPRPFRTIKSPAGKSSVSKTRIRSAVKFATTSRIYAYSPKKSRASKKSTASQISIAVKKPSSIIRTPLLEISPSQKKVFSSFFSGSVAGPKFSR